MSEGIAQGGWKSGGVWWERFGIVQARPSVVGGEERGRAVKRAIKGARDRCVPAK